jgi:Mn-dependent DtxR family transcriptional regulator
MKKVYLGDSVYVEFDGYGLVLTTENGYGPTNTIIMEPEVVHNLQEYVAALKEEASDARASEEDHDADDSICRCKDRLPHIPGQLGPNGEQCDAAKRGDNQ